MPRISTDNYDTVAAWNGSQDLFVVEQPDGTKVATPNMFRQFLESFYDDVPTESSDNAVKSGGIFNSVNAVKNKLITENWTSGRITDTNNFTFNGFTGTITNGWVFYSKSNSAIIINIFMYITNAVFTNRTNPYIDIKLPVKFKYSFDRLFAGVFGTGATAQAVYGRRAEDAFITVNENSDTIRLIKHNFVQGATDGVVVILTPEIIIPIV